MIDRVNCIGANGIARDGAITITAAVETGVSMPRNHPIEQSCPLGPLPSPSYLLSGRVPLYPPRAPSFVSCLSHVFVFAPPSIPRLARCSIVLPLTVLSSYPVFPSRALFLCHDNAARFNNPPRPRHPFPNKSHSQPSDCAAIRGLASVKIDRLQIFIKRDVRLERPAVLQNLDRLLEGETVRNRFRGSLKFHAKFIGLDLPADKIPLRRHFTGL